MARKRYASFASLVRLTPEMHIFNQLDMNSILSRTSLEIIGCAGIGHSFDSLDSAEERADQYTESLKNLTSVSIIRA